MKKLLAILFAAVLCIALGVTAWAEEANYTLVLSGGKGYQTEVNTGIQVDLSRLNITYNSDKQTYTFNNVNFITSAATAIKIADYNANVVITGTNTVSGSNSDTSTCGIRFEGTGTHIVSGEGTLSVTAGKTTASTGYSYGIYCNGNLTVNSGSLTAIGGECKNSYGIYVSEGDVNVSGGSLTAAGGKATDDTSGYSYGIYISGRDMDDDIIISGGTVTAKGGEAAISSYGISNTNGKVVISNGTVNATGDAATNSDSFGISGYYVEISGGTVTATGGTAKESYGIYARHYRSDYFAVDITGGTVTATGGQATTASYGLYASNESGKIVIYGGTVIAKTTATGEGVTKAAMATAGKDNTGKDKININSSEWKYKDSEDENAEYQNNGNIATLAAGAYLEIAQGRAIPTYTIVLSGGKVYKDSADAENEITGAALTTLGIGYENGKYEFSNVDFKTSAQYAIEVKDANAEIIITNDNIIKGGASQAYTAGIYHSSNENGTKILKFSGTGSLTVTAGEAITSGEYQRSSRGIESEYGNIVIEGSVTINATGGKAGKNSYGIYAMNSVSISDTAKVTATGGEATEESYGVCFAGSSKELDLSGLEDGGKFIAVCNSGASKKGATNGSADFPTYWKYRTQNNGDFTRGAELTDDLKAATYLEIVKAEAPVYYTVTYNANGATKGTAPDEASYLSGTEVTVAAGTNLSKDGYTFAGWNTNEDGTGEDYAVGRKFDISANVTLYAIWEAIPTYTVSFNANTGSGNMDSVTVEAGEYTIPECKFTAPDGQRFKGWATSTDGEVITTYNVTANVEFYAIWEDIPTYTVKFNGNGAAGTMADVTGIYGNYNLPACGFTTPDGQRFKGWATSTNGEVITETTIPVTTNITLYAIWEAIPTYKVTYDANGGEGTVPTEASYLSGATVTVKSGEGLTKTGYTFAGWMHDDGTVVGATFIITKNTTLTAKWEAKPTTPDTEEPKPTTRPAPCDHDLDANGKCKDCGVVIISYPRDEAETNPNTGAETAAAAIVGCAVLAAAGAVCLGKKR